MDDPARLMDEGATELERTLLATARLERPDPTLAARMRAGIGLGTAAPVATGTRLAVRLWGAAGAVVLVGAGVAWLGLHSRPVESRPAVVQSAAPEVMSAPPTAAGADSVTPAVGQNRARSVVLPGGPAKPAAAGRRGESTAPASDLPDEVRRLDRVRASLRGDNVRRALTELEAYASRHPAGILRPEAAVLRIEALDRTGDRARALALAREFAAEHPGSPLLERLRRFGLGD